MNKMQNIVSASGNDLLKRRAKQVVELIQMEQEQVVNNLNREVIALEGKLDATLDLSVKSRDSLTIVDGQFDERKFCAAIQGIKVDMRNKQIELDIARNTMSDLFGGVETAEIVEENK